MGGLQSFLALILRLFNSCFNTEDGRGRAAIPDCRWLRPRRRCFNTEDGRGRAAISFSPISQGPLNKFQYRGRSWEGCNTVPLSPWGYWPQMSKMENLCDFPAFSSLRQQALFAFCSGTISETLALQGFAVFGKKLENLRPF